MTTETMQQKTFSFELVSPERRLIEGPARLAVIPGVEGDFGVLAGHSALLSALRPGVIALDMEGAEGERQNIFIAGGFADVTGERCTVLAEEAIPVAELDRTALETDLANLREDLAGVHNTALREPILRRIALVCAKLTAATGHLVTP